MGLVTDWHTEPQTPQNENVDVVVGPTNVGVSVFIFLSIFFYGRPPSFSAPVIAVGEGGRVTGVQPVLCFSAFMLPRRATKMRL